MSTMCLRLKAGGWPGGGYLGGFGKKYTLDADTTSSSRALA